MVHGAMHIPRLTPSHSHPPPSQVVGQDASEVDKLRLQAQRVLLHAQDENSALERDLETQLHQMNSAHAMLEDLRSR